jgi:mannose-6-phosphate isomerase-like protein (cupin superfamily)
MARKSRRSASRKPARGKARKAARPKKAARRSSKPSTAAIAPVRGAERRELGHVIVEVGKAGAARIKRMIYPPGFHWEQDMKPVTGTSLCMHAHVGFLVSGEIHIEYADGCVVEFKAPQVVAIDPGHDGWVVGKQPAVLIEIDFERDTVAKLGMPAAHQH